MAVVNRLVWGKGIKGNRKKKQMCLIIYRKQNDAGWLLRSWVKWKIDKYEKKKKDKFVGTDINI